jgi:hypothetical protein
VLRSAHFSLRLTTFLRLTGKINTPLGLPIIFLMYFPGRPDLPNLEGVSAGRKVVGKIIGLSTEASGQENSSLRRPPGRENRPAW